MTEKTIKITYYALLREQRGVGSEELQTCAQDLTELYQLLKNQYSFTLPEDQLRVAVNDEFCRFEKIIESGDRVVFVPPVAGG